MIRQQRLIASMPECDPLRAEMEELEIIAQEREAVLAGIAWARHEQLRAPTPELARTLANLGQQLAAVGRDLTVLIERKYARRSATPEEDQ
jgi:hypothetical protein